MTVFSELNYFQEFVENIFDVGIDPHPRLLCINAAKYKPERNIIGIGIGSGVSNWPIGYWIDLVSHLQKSSWQIILFGGEDDIKISAYVEQNCNGCQNLAGTLTFVESIQYLNKLSAFIGNDTGFTHFASLVVPNCLVISGGGTFRRFFPWPDVSNQYVIYHALDCFDCDWECKFNEKHCLHLIRPSNVLKYFNEIMSPEETSNIYNLNPFAGQYQVAWRRWEGNALYSTFQDNDVARIIHKF